MTESAAWNHGIPLCRICGDRHWLRDGCDGRLQERVAKTNTPGGGRDVLKGAKPTSPPATASPDPALRKTPAKRKRAKKKRKAKRGGKMK